MATALKWLATIRISLSNQMVYKVNFILLTIAPTLVFFFVKYNLWSAIFERTPEVGGYNFSTMIQYQVWVLVVGFLAQGFNSMQLAEDIRMGRISSYLIYPFGFWQYHAASFLAFQAVQIFVASFSVAVLLGFGMLPALNWGNLVGGALLASAVGVLWFMVQFTLGIVAFWLEETWVLRVMFLFVAQFFSGSIIPIELYPQWLREGLLYSPFPYMTYIPVKFMMGEHTGGLAASVGVVFLWTLTIAGIAALIWRKGIRMYTAAGI